MFNSNILKNGIKELLFPAPPLRYDSSFPGYVNVSDGVDPDWDNIAAFVRRGKAGKKAILYCHGNGEDLVSAACHMQLFAARGYTVAAVDYPGYGLSDGPQNYGTCCVNANELLRYLVECEEFEPKDVVVMGVSLGSGVASYLAGESDIAFGGLILEAGFYSADRMAEYMARRLGIGALSSLVKNYLDGDRLENHRRISRAGMPVLSIHGTVDDVVPIEQGRELYELAPKKAGFVEVPGAGHCNFIDVMGEKTYVDTVVKFIEALP